jgi:hypothetical protein
MLHAGQIIKEPNGKNDKFRRRKYCTIKGGPCERVKHFKISSILVLGRSQ